ncbi:hypothetical protein ES703_49533 [subsurface metagenome]
MTLKEAVGILSRPEPTLNSPGRKEWLEAIKLCAHSAGFQLHLRRDKASLANALLPGETKD